MNLAQSIKQLGEQAKIASRTLATLSTQQKNTILLAMAEQLISQTDLILQVNQKDLQRAQQNNTPAALIDRLALSKERIAAIAEGIRTVSQLADPVGHVLSQFQHDNGMLIEKVSVPIGVIAVIYESRPNVTADVAALCLKAGNALILRGGSDALNSNIAIATALNDAAKQSGLPKHSLQLITQTDYLAVQHLVQLTDDVDLVIPRGGEKLIKAVAKLATVPVIKHYKGLCHTYVDAQADLNMAVKICENAKCQRPGVCNAMETLLVHRAIAEKFLPMVVTVLKQHKVTIKGDAHATAIIPSLLPTNEQDWDTEYLDLVLSIKIVDHLEQAIEHINQHGSHHSDAIITEDSKAQQQFCQMVDSASVYVNASTRFTDGSQFGMGAEIGISTDKLHARGPMGLAELTTYKYIIKGQGQIR